MPGSLLKGDCLAGMCAALLAAAQYHRLAQLRDSCRLQQIALGRRPLTAGVSCWTAWKQPCRMVLWPELLRYIWGLTVVLRRVQDGALTGSHSESWQSSARCTGSLLQSQQTHCMASCCCSADNPGIGFASAPLPCLQGPYCDTNTQGAGTQASCCLMRLGLLPYISSA